MADVESLALRRHLGRNFFGVGPRRSESEFGSLLNEISRFAFNRLDLSAGYDFLAFEIAGEAGNGILFLPFGELRQLAVLRRIAFVMASQAMGQAFDKARALAGAPMLHC